MNLLSLFIFNITKITDKTKLSINYLESYDFSSSKKSSNEDVCF